MSTSNGFTPWDDLSRKRQVVLETATTEFGDETFACGELNDHLSEPTTTQTLNKISEEDGYLRRWPGGSSMLLAIVDHEPNKTAFGPAQEEDLAKRMVRKADLPLDTEAVNWADNDDRQRFADEFNRHAIGIELEATWTRNKYRVKSDAQQVVRR